jgi:hypothetical protein
MSKNQVESIVLSALRIAGVVLMFSAKAIVYLCIALAVVGQLLFQEYVSPEVTEVSPELGATSPEVTEVDPWEEPIAPVATMAKTIARPEAVLVVSESEMEAIAIDADAQRYRGMGAIELRKECSAIGIKWRNAHGVSQHLSKAEMLDALGI